MTNSDKSTSGSITGSYSDVVDIVCDVGYSFVHSNPPEDRRRELSENGSTMCLSDGRFEIVTCEGK